MEDGDGSDLVPRCVQNDELFWALPCISPTYNFMLRVTAFLATIWIFGRLMQTLKLPASIGALAAGIMLGPAGLAQVPFAVGACATDDPSLTNGTGAAPILEQHSDCGLDPWRLVGNIGITLLIFEFGTFVNLTKIKQVRWRSLTIALVSTLLPVVVGVVFVAAIFSHREGTSFAQYLPDGFAAGVVLAPTSPVVLRALDEDDLLNTLPGQTSLYGIFVGMILSLVANVVLINIAGSSSLSAVALTSAITRPLFLSLAFLAAGLFLALKVFPHLERAIDLVPRVGRVSIQPRDEVHLICMLATLVVFSTATTILCGDYLLGAFIAGMCFVNVGRSRQVWRVQLKRIRAWCVRMFYACTVGFAVPASAFATDADLIVYGLLLGVVGGVVAKLLSALTVRFAQGMGRAERASAMRASRITRSGHVEPSQVLVGAALIARGEFSFLIAEQARSNFYMPSGGQNRTMRPDVHLVVIWALFVTLVVAPISMRWSIGVFKRGRHVMRRRSLTGEDLGAVQPTTSFQMNIVGRHFPGLVTEIANTLRASGVDIFEAHVTCDGLNEMSRLIVRPRGKTEDFDEERVDQMRGAIEQLTGEKDSVVYFEQQDEEKLKHRCVIEIHAVGEVRRHGAARLVTAICSEIGLYAIQSSGDATIQTVRGFQQRIGTAEWYAINKDATLAVTEERVRQLRMLLSFMSSAQDFKEWIVGSFVVKLVHLNDTPPKPFNAFCRYSALIKSHAYSRDGWQDGPTPSATSATGASNEDESKHGSSFCKGHFTKSDAKSSSSPDNSMSKKKANKKERRDSPEFDISQLHPALLADPAVLGARASVNASSSDDDGKEKDVSWCAPLPDRWESSPDYFMTDIEHGHEELTAPVYTPPPRRPSRVEGMIQTVRRASRQTCSTDPGKAAAEGTASPNGTRNAAPTYGRRMSKSSCFDAAASAAGSAAAVMRRVSKTSGDTPNGPMERRGSRGSCFDGVSRSLRRGSRSSQYDVSAQPVVQAPKVPTAPTTEQILDGINLHGFNVEAFVARTREEMDAAGLSRRRCSSLRLRSGWARG